MKILLDPVYTNPAHKCASAVKFKKIVQHLLESTDDTFFYWIKHHPDDFGHEVPEDWWPKSDRIEYRTINYSSDRYREFNRFREEYEWLVSKCGVWWDWDVMITNRVAGINNIRIHSYDGRGGGGSIEKEVKHRTIICLDDMPLFGYKTKALVHGKYSEMGQASGYMNSDLVLLNDFWQRQRVIDASSSYLSPSMIRELRGKIKSVSPALVEHFELKTKDFVNQEMERKKPFTLSFSGRMITAHHLDEIFKVMANKFAIGGDSVRCLVTTQSMATGRVDMDAAKDFVEIIYADRDTFWDVVKNRSSVGIFYSEDQDYSMSVMEPIILGLPVLLYRCEWAEKSVGEDYPYFFRTMQECYGLICLFYENYAKEYLNFCRWYTTSFKQTMLERNKVYLPYVVRDYLKSDETLKRDATKLGNYDRQLHQLLRDKFGDEVKDIVEAMKLGDKAGISTSAKQWVNGLDINHRMRWSLIPSIHTIKRALVAQGWRDASVKVGHMKYAPDTPEPPM